jgi:hypothetical protein
MKKTAAECAHDYANKVFTQTIKAFRRKNRNEIVFAALYVFHQQAVNTYHVLADRENQAKQQRWRAAA